MPILRIFFTVFITISVFITLPAPAHSREFSIADFEKDPQGWEIPDWALDKRDYVARQIGVSEFHSSSGKYALEVESEFSGAPSWEGVYVEKVIEITDWSPFRYFSADIFLPKEAPRGLRARIIMTVGEDWKWTEANKSIPLAPGEWTVLKVDMTPESTNWRRFLTDEFRADVRKAGVRIESNGKIAYKGPIYIDNVKLSD